MHSENYITFGPFSLLRVGRIWSFEAFGFQLIRRPGSLMLWRIVE